MHIIYIYIYIYISDEHYIPEVEMKTTSNSSSKTRGAAAPTLELLGVFLRFRITFAEVITFSGASAHEF